MASSKLVAILLLSVLYVGVKSYENIGTNVASSLRHCYNTTELHDPDQRLPATINMFIDLIRLVEDGSPGLDARTLSIQLIHRFRQDGIQKALGHNNINILPYSPKGDETFKSRIILWKLIPGDAVLFRNESLTLPEQCALHFMTSNTLETQPRGDEYTVCKYAAKYIRRPRSTEDLDRVEPFDNQEQVEQIPRGPKGTVNTQLSDCPVENGVVYTRWGEVHAGTLLAAIAAGYETQIFTDENYRVDSKYAVTLSGDLVEVALIQGATDDTYTIGARGGFNSTLAPHWYFKDGQQHVYLTNPELRADIDGLIIASNLREWADKYRSLKVSQILDAYYSNRGIFSSDFKACNRNKFTSQYAPTDRLTAETFNFAKMYNKWSTLSASPDDENIKTLTERAIREYNMAVSNIANVKCDIEDVDRIASDIIFAIDPTFSFDFIHRTVSYLLDNLDINRYESNYTVINAKDGSVLVNTTWSIAKFAQEFNQSSYNKITERGFDAGRLMTTVETLHEIRAQYFQDRNKLSGKSSVVILMPKNTNTNEGDYIQSRFTGIIDSYYPGTQHIVLGPGSRDVYNNFVRNPSTDIFTVVDYIGSNEDQIKTTLNSLIARIRNAPRNIVNPKCGPSMSGGGSSDTMELYIEPGTTNFYRVSNQYVSGGSASIKLRPSSSGNITVCSGSGDEKPTDNCEPLKNGEKTFEIAGDFNFALIAGHTTENSNVRCSDKDCRFPDNLKVTLQLNGFTCSQNNFGIRPGTSLSMIMTVIAIYLFK